MPNYTISQTGNQLQDLLNTVATKQTIIDNLTGIFRGSFSSESAMTVGVISPAAGDSSITTDNDTLWIFDGTIWVAINPSYSEQFKYFVSSTTNIVAHTNNTSGEYLNASIVPLNAANVVSANAFQISGNTIECTIAGSYQIDAEFLVFDSGGTNSSAVFCYLGDGTVPYGFYGSTRLGTNVHGTVYKRHVGNFTVGQQIDIRITNPTNENVSMRGINLSISSA